MSSFAEVAGYFVSPFLWAGAWLAVKITVISMVLGFALGLGLALAADVAVAPPQRARLDLHLGGAGDAAIAAARLHLRRAAGHRAEVRQLHHRRDRLFAQPSRLLAEVLSGGILSVNPQQGVAAGSLGMGRFLTLRRIILPQAMRAILPAITNDTIGMLKLTSIASIIFVNELTFRAQGIVGENFKFFTVFAGAGAIYLAMTSVISALQQALDRYFDPDRLRSSRPNPMTGAWLGALLPSVRSPSPIPAAPARVELAPGAGRDNLTEILGTRKAGPENEATVFVHCHNVQKSYGEAQILKSVDFDVKRGEVVVIIGPSGSGKSTLLRLINHLESLDAGEITVAGKQVGYVKRERRTRPRRPIAPRRAPMRASAWCSSNSICSATRLRSKISSKRPFRSMATKREGRRSRGTRSARDRRAGAVMPITCHIGFRAASSSGSPSPAVSPCRPNSCSSTNRPRRSTRNSWAKC